MKRRSRTKHFRGGANDTQKEHTRGFHQWVHLTAQLMLKFPTRWEIQIPTCGVQGHRGVRETPRRGVLLGVLQWEMHPSVFQAEPMPPAAHIQSWAKTGMSEQWMTTRSQR